MRIFKYELVEDINIPQLIRIPAKRLLSVCEQNDRIVVYAEVDDDLPEKEFLFHVCGTGFDLYSIINDSSTYLGTVNLQDGLYMYHIYYADMDKIDPKIAERIRALYNGGTLWNR